MVASSSTGEMPLGKHLASSDKKIRDKAVEQLTAFLSDEPNAKMPEPEMRKLWKALFYCFWMSDKPLVQQALASDLANLLLEIPSTPASLAFLRGFWEALVREWSGLDRLRLDKYYMLVRRFTNASFRLLIRTDWEESACREYQDIIGGTKGPLYAEDSRIPSSLAYHLSDIYLEELDKAIASTDSKDGQNAPLISLVSPFLTLAARTPSNPTYTRIQSNLLDPLLAALLPTPPTDSEPEEPAAKRRRVSTDTPLSNIRQHVRPSSVETPKELRKLVLRSVFEAASREDARPANRKKMYAIWRADEDDEDEG
ncbi:hypothetical protein BOTBODRAFT_108450 [Botryobasidium botryosum FD-172 SS1]|uniref:Ribosomal RNA-processing protein 1 n=1 Tax=Botryobasidium botryosum (strain FD-172 SS1) TaxID=930990 RepID=A0A067MIS5_BOTB1|nr:hypothetical protein BOTBODRAFT_108450 [Botryobasidium botryosum FD-172 SS1]